MSAKQPEPHSVSAEFAHTVASLTDALKVLAKDAPKDAEVVFNGDTVTAHWVT